MHNTSGCHFRFEHISPKVAVFNLRVIETLLRRTSSDSDYENH